MHTFKAKPEKKQKKAKLRSREPLTETTSTGIQCGHCGHRREADATVPDWQCPCCSSAYNKVDPAEKKREKVKHKQKRIEQQEEVKRKTLRERTLTGLIGGAGVVGLAIGTTASNCLNTVSRPTSPGGIAIGLLIIAASVGYFFWKSGAS